MGAVWRFVYVHVAVAVAAALAAALAAAGAAAALAAAAHAAAAYMPPVVAANKLSPVAAVMSSTWNGNCAASKCVDGDDTTAANCNSVSTSMCHSESNGDNVAEIDWALRTSSRISS